MSVMLLLALATAHAGGLTREAVVLDGVPLDDSLRPRVVDGERRPAPALPIHRAVGAPIDRATALAAAGSRVGGLRPSARLTWQILGDELRQVWSLQYERGLPGTGFTAPVVRVDGLSGAVIDVREGALHAGPEALVYETNPRLEDEPRVVTLPDAVDGLYDDRLELRQCRDLGETVDVDIYGVVWPLRICTEVAADGPVDGSYVTDPVPWPDDPARDEDTFAAPHTYWNVHRGLDWFEALGWEPADDLDPYLEVVVNQRDTDLWSEETATDPDAALRPYDNAYFTGMFESWSDGWINARFVFGQGTQADYAYDADVVLHELGHYIFRSNHGPWWSEDTRYGPSVAASAINEGLADYWSAVIQGDSDLAEYAGGEAGVIRELDGDRMCGRDSYGESHYDGLILAQALWSAREEVDPTLRTRFDQGVLASIPRFAEPATMEDAAATLVDQVTEHAGAEPGALLEAELERRGLFDCAPVIDVVPGPDPIRDFTVAYPSSPWLHLGAIPASVQLRVEVPEGGQTLRLRHGQTEFLGLDLVGTNAPLPLEVVGRNAEKLRWTQDPANSEFEYEGQLYNLIVDEWSHNGAWLGTSHVIETRTSSDGRYLLHTYETRLELTEGTWVLQLVNPHDRFTYALDLTLDEVAPPPSYQAQSSRLAPEEVAACGCASSGGPAGVLTLLGLLAVRRRR